jgi:hypothetical protein
MLLTVEVHSCVDIDDVSIKFLCHDKFLMVDMMIILCHS